MDGADVPSKVLPKNIPRQSLPKGETKKQAATSNNLFACLAGPGVKSRTHNDANRIVSIGEKTGVPAFGATAFREAHVEKSKEKRPRKAPPTKRLM